MCFALDFLIFEMNFVFIVFVRPLQVDKASKRMKQWLLKPAEDSENGD